jgi:hypothetical protein
MNCTAGEKSEYGPAECEEEREGKREEANAPKPSHCSIKGDSGTFGPTFGH